MKLLNRYGLQPEHITPHSPEQKEAIERFIRTLKEECIWLNSFIKSVREPWIAECNTSLIGIAFRKSLDPFVILLE